MKKTISIILLVFSLTILFTGCGSKKQSTNPDENRATTQKSELKIQELTHSLADYKDEYNIAHKGDYYIFSCQTSDVYVTFLDELDENKYEIVNNEIQHFSDGNFWVTYRIKAASK